MPDRVFYFLPIWLTLLQMDQALIGPGGGLEARLINRFMFCTVAVSKNSSFAPVIPRNLNLVITMFRFASPNILSIFLRSRADWL